LDEFLSANKGGEVIDVQFIPNYDKILMLEREKNQLFDLKNLINKKEDSFIRKYFYPKIFRKDEGILKKIEEIDNLIDKETENPVESSGHAFVCFDSLLSAYKCLNIYEENLFKKIKLRLKSIIDYIKFIFKYGFRNNRTNSFRKFNDEILDIENNNNSNNNKNMNRSNSNNSFNAEKINILVDQMMEPYDIIWTNIGGNRGIYIFRHIFIYVMAFVVLFFLTTPTVKFIFNYIFIFICNYLLYFRHFFLR
jgi:hypothetical protein